MTLAEEESGTPLPFNSYSMINISHESCPNLPPTWPIHCPCHQLPKICHSHWFCLCHWPLQLTQPFLWHLSTHTPQCPNLYYPLCLPAEIVEHHNLTLLSHAGFATSLRSSNSSLSTHFWTVISWNTKNDGEFITIFQHTAQSPSSDVLIFFSLLMGNDYNNGVCLCQNYLHKYDQF